MKLVTENWVDSINHETISEDPDFSDIENALNNLDGIKHSLLEIEINSGVILQIGGGPKEYMSQIINGDSIWLANGKITDDKIIQLSVGGQLSEFENKAILNKEEARDILMVFYHGNGVLTTTCLLYTSPSPRD